MIGEATNNYAQRGYSLIEMIVTVGIFSLAFTAIAAIFIGYTTAQSRASVAQRLLNDGNYILESMTREMRMNEYAYDCDGWNPATETNAICLRSFDGRTIRFYYHNPDPAQPQLADLLVCKSGTEDDCSLSLAASSGGAWTSMKPNYMEVTNVAFNVSPVVDPSNASTMMAAAWQPMATIRLTVASGNGRARQTYSFQTAASSRVYVQ